MTGKDVYNDAVNISNKTDLIEGQVVVMINRRAKLQDGILLFASTGTGTVGRMAYIKEYTGNWAVSETMYCIKLSKDVNPLFVMNYLYSSHARNQFEPKISKGSVPHLKIADLLDVKIPLLTMPEQNKLVDILSKFSRLSMSLTEGLPAEIKARQQQYEYYRDKLLTFRRKAC